MFADLPSKVKSTSGGWGINNSIGSIFVAKIVSKVHSTGASDSPSAFSRLGGKVRDRTSITGLNHVQAAVGTGDVNQSTVGAGSDCITGSKPTSKGKSDVPLDHGFIKIVIAPGNGC